MELDSRGGLSRIKEQSNTDRIDRAVKNMLSAVVDSIAIVQWPCFEHLIPAYLAQGKLRGGSTHHSSETTILAMF